MMSRFYNKSQMCYNNYVTEYCPAFLFALTSYLRYYRNSPALRQKAVNCSVTRTIAGPAQAGLNILNAKTDALMVGRLGVGFAKGFSMTRTANRMIAPLKVAVKLFPKHFPIIPKESPGNSPNFASDSMFLSVVRCNEPGRSTLHSPMAAPVADTLLPGAASPGGVG